MTVSPAACQAPLALDAVGWLHRARGVQRCLSPNHDARPENEAPTLLVLHNISLPPGEFGGNAITEFFLNELDFDAHPWFDRIRTLHVSAHFLVRRDGTIIQFVPTTLRAWHAGQSSFQGRARCNDFSVGIELEGTDSIPYAEAQYHTLTRLARAIRQRHSIRWVCGHEHIAPGRKTDPGPAFDWLRFQRDGGWLTTQMAGVQPGSAGQ